MTALAGGVGKDEGVVRAGALWSDIFMILTNRGCLRSKKSCHTYFLNYEPEKRLHSKNNLFQRLFCKAHRFAYILHAGFLVSRMCIKLNRQERILKSTSIHTFAWLGAASVAIALALAAPNEASVMGQLPPFMTKTLMQQSMTLPEGLPSDRTLALITFQKGQRAQAEGWIEGLNLRRDPSISWMRMPVLNDPGTPGGRSEVENRLLQHYTADAERARLVPIFTDRASFVRAIGLHSTDRFYAVVVNRRGDVLARIEGAFSEDKAQVLRETLKAQHF